MKLAFWVAVVLVCLHTAPAYFIGGLIGGLLFNWRLVRDVITEYRWHGRDNHFCGRPSCCP